MEKFNEKMAKKLNKNVQKFREKNDVILCFFPLVFAAYNFFSLKIWMLKFGIAEY